MQFALSMLFGLLVAALVLHATKAVDLGDGVPIASDGLAADPDPAVRQLELTVGRPDHQLRLTLREGDVLSEVGGRACAALDIETTSDECAGLIRSMGERWVAEYGQDSVATRPGAKVPAEADGAAARAPDAAAGDPESIGIPYAFSTTFRQSVARFMASNALVAPTEVVDQLTFHMQRRALEHVAQNGAVGEAAAPIFAVQAQQQVDDGNADVLTMLVTAPATSGVEVVSRAGVCVLSDASAQSSCVERTGAALEERLASLRSKYDVLVAAGGSVTALPQEEMLAFLDAFAGLLLRSGVDPDGVDAPVLSVLTESLIRAGVRRQDDTAAAADEAAQQVPQAAEQVPQAAEQVPQAAEQVPQAAEQVPQAAGQDATSSPAAGLSSVQFEVDGVLQTAEFPVATASTPSGARMLAATALEHFGMRDEDLVLRLASQIHARALMASQGGTSEEPVPSDAPAEVASAPVEAPSAPPPSPTPTAAQRLEREAPARAAPSAPAPPPTPTPPAPPATERALPADAGPTAKPPVSSATAAPPAEATDTNTDNGGQPEGSLLHRLTFFRNLDKGKKSALGIIFAVLLLSLPCVLYLSPFGSGPLAEDDPDVASRAAAAAATADGSNRAEAPPSVRRRSGRVRRAAPVT